ncbi:MAG: winged helix-turn-helix transcriptional regulator [Mycobacteriales bacterium]
MLPRDYLAINCSVARTLEILGDRWTMLIVRNALVGQTRFEAFLGLGVARNVLTDRLTRLTEEGILARRPYQQRPLRHDYVITDKGRALWPVLAALVEWGDTYHAPHGAPRLLVHHDCGGQLRQHLTCQRCHTHVSNEAIDTRPGPGARTDAA